MRDWQWDETGAAMRAAIRATTRVPTRALTGEATETPMRVHILY